MARTAGADGPARGAWLAHSRFAMFCHWGLYAELAGRWRGRTYYGISEWIMHRAQIPIAEYEQVARRFNPVDFDAGEWVALAKAAGMRHLMITAKHHDGFAMFRSRVSPYNIVDATPFGRDPMAELSAACAEQGLRFGFYYSQTADWHELDAVGNSWDTPPADRDFQRYLRTKAIPQLEELLTGYGPIAGIWFDTPGSIAPEQSAELVALVHRLQPECLVNSRIGNGLGDYDTLGDQEIPRLPRSGLWETPDTSNDTWAYAWYDQNWKSAGEIARRLVRVVSRGGTYLLNVGPDGRGRIPDACAEILREVGGWVGEHEAALHGAGATPLGPLPWGECTTEGARLHLHVFDWPADGRLVVPGLRGRALAAHVDGEPVGLEPLAGGWLVRLPLVRPRTLLPVVTLEMDGDLEAVRDQAVLAGHANRLESGVAELSGCAPREVRWMEKFGDWQLAECLGGWTGAEATATWTFDTLEPGRWYLEIEYTCPEADDYSEWQVTLDGERLTFPLLDTGERPHRRVFGGALPRFRTYRVGLIEVPRAGRHSLVLGPAGEGGLGIRVAGPRLLPVD